jgi:branched-chain amino acid transport system ATP-binding protein
MSAPLLEVEDLHVSYGRLRVLQGVSIEIGAGDAVGLLGTNGAGKSTLLKAISGIVPVVGGAIRLDGVDVTGASPRRILDRGIVHIAGGRATFPNLTVAESLRVGCWSFRRDKPRVSDAVDRAFATFPLLHERSRQLAGTLSGGQQQMLAVARGLLHEPRLLVIDELSLGLAPMVTSELIDIVQGIQATGVALLLVDQRLANAVRATDRAYFLERGAVRFAGPTAELEARGDLVRSVFLAGSGS